MGTLEIIGGALLIVASIVIILVVLCQESKTPGLSSAIGGGSEDSYFGKNAGRTKEARLNGLTKICAIIFFVVTILVNVFIVIANGKDDTKGTNSSTPNSSTPSSSVAADSSEATDVESTTDAQ